VKKKFHFYLSNNIISFFRLL